MVRAYVRGCGQTKLQPCPTSRKLASFSTPEHCDALRACTCPEAVSTEQSALFCRICSKAELSEPLNGVVSARNSVLVLGCGLSSLPEHLYDE